MVRASLDDDQSRGRLDWRIANAAWVVARPGACTDERAREKSCVGPKLRHPWSILAEVLRMKRATALDEILDELGRRTTVPLRAEKPFDPNLSSRIDALDVSDAVKAGLHVLNDDL